MTKYMAQRNVCSYSFHNEKDDEKQPFLLVMGFLANQTENLNEYKKLDLYSYFHRKHGHFCTSIKNQEKTQLKERTERSISLEVICGLLMSPHTNTLYVTNNLILRDSNPNRLGSIYLWPYI